MRYSKTIEMDLPYKDAVVGGEGGLHGARFGTLSEIDVRPRSRRRSRRTLSHS